MTYTVEILLRETHRVVTERVDRDGPEPADWGDGDVSAVLREMLLALDRVKSSGVEPAAKVALRGLSWIVTPFQDGVAIAIEIPSGTAVAGPFSIDQRRLETMIERVLADPQPNRTVVH
jgi:hypothetical protein